MPKKLLVPIDTVDEEMLHGFGQLLDDLLDLRPRRPAVCSIVLFSGPEPTTYT